MLNIYIYINLDFATASYYRIVYAAWQIKISAEGNLIPVVPVIIELFSAVSNFVTAGGSAENREYFNLYRNGSLMTACSCKSGEKLRPHGSEYEVLD